MTYISSKEKREAKRHTHIYKRFLILGAISFITLLMVVYGSRCVSTEVCGITFLDTWVRKEITLVTPKKSISVEVVDTVESRELGLSGRGHVSRDGMLFVFDFPGKYAFWMKDMTFPLDIIWISSAGIVVHVEKNVTPESYPKTVVNNIEAKYVLELPIGKADEYGITLGSKIKM